MSSADGRLRVACVGALAYDEHGRLLLVRRLRDPGAGTWSVPGGRVEAGEDQAAAVVREVREETGLDVSVRAVVGRVEREFGELVYEIADYAVTVVGGELVAGDDAAEVRWADADELASLPTSPGLLDSLREWGAMPR